MSRKKNSINNLLWGIVGTIITSAVAIIIPRLFIVNYGSEINGLLSSIRQIYVYLALLEFGVGDASVVALYGPIGRQDYEKSNRILAATHYFYKRIGFVYGFLVLALGFLYPLLIKSSIPYWACFGIIVLQGAGGVISYLYQGKYNMLLRVDNKNYITTNLNTITGVCTDIVRIILLLNGKSIVVIQATYLGFSLIKMIYISWYIRKHYTWIDLTVRPNFDAISQKSAVIVHQISSLVFSHTDVFILTFVCGLKVVSIYSLYATMYAMVNNVIQITSNSVQAAMGQIFHNDRKKFIEIQEAFETYYLTLVFALFAITSIFILPFMKLYTNGADVNYIDWKLPVLFGLYQLLNYGRVTSSNIISYAGEFKATQWRAWIETGINLCVSLIAVFKFGIYGVLLGTVAALLYRANDMILFANHRVMHRSALPTYRRWCYNAIIFGVVVWFFLNIPMNNEDYVHLIINAVWVSLITLFFFFTIISILEKKSRKIAWMYIKPILKKMKDF